MRSLSTVSAVVFLIWAPSVYSFSVQTIKNVPGIQNSQIFHNDPLLKKIKTTLEQGDLVQFYEETKSVIDQHEVSTASETLEGNKMDRQLLIDQYVVMVPLFEVNADSPFQESCRMHRDIERKNGVMNDLYVISRSNAEQDRSVSQKKETARLCSIYASIVMRTLRHHYQANIKEKNFEIRKKNKLVREKEVVDKWGEFIKERERYSRTFKQPVSEGEKNKAQEMNEKEKAYIKDVRKMINAERELEDVLFTLEMRNSFIERSFKRREGLLVDILLVNCSGKSSEVFKYLKMAGYKEEEMMDMVDQTIGRKAKTEFLYNSFLGRQFLKTKGKQTLSESGAVDD